MAVPSSSWRHIPNLEGAHVLGEVVVQVVVEVVLASAEVVPAAVEVEI